MHDKKNYKFFCFSNIFPVYDFKINDERTLIIAAPDNDFIDFLYEHLNNKIIINDDIKINYMHFKIENLKKLELDVNTYSLLITNTPVIVRIPKERYIKYNIKPAVDYDYIYWRSEYPIDLFISQIEKNILKKYAEYSKLNFKYKVKDIHFDDCSFQSNFFHQFKFKKQISTRIKIKGSEQIIIGTLWEFVFNPNFNKKLMNFIVDVGLGERNSLGFGFVNLKKPK
jgi:CRISPR-associated endoribonuclease Cas6